MQTTDIIILAAVGIVGYGLIKKSTFFQGVGDVAGGAGVAAQGLGEGISGVASDIAQTTDNIATFLNPLGAMGEAISKNIQDIQAIQSSIRSREYEQAAQVDILSYQQTQPELVKIQSSTDILKAQQKSLRVEDWETTKTSVQDSATNVIESWASAGSKLTAYNPLTQIQSFMTNIVKSIRIPAAITGQAVSTTPTATTTPTISTGTSSLRVSTGGSGGSSPASIPSTKVVSKVEDLYPAFKYPTCAAPTKSIRSEPVKKWYDPRTWF